MSWKVTPRGKLLDINGKPRIYVYVLENKKLRSIVYVGIYNNRIIISGYPMRIGIVKLTIKHPLPHPEMIEKILAHEPLELIIDYNPKIEVSLELPPLKNYKKLYTYANMEFAVFEYSDGYILVGKNFYKIGAGKVPYFNDDVSDLRFFFTQDVSEEIIYAIDEKRKVLDFYTLL